MILVLGAGLAGLSTAAHLGRTPHRVLEREDEVGGLARSVRVDGFRFDFAGHVLHVRTPEVSALVDELLGDRLVEHERSAWVRIGDVTVPYPIQVHTHGLPVDVRVECLAGFARTLVARRGAPAEAVEAATAATEPLPLSFLNLPPAPAGGGPSLDAWSERTFGSGFSRRFFRPYHAKVFAADPSTLTPDWVSWAVPRPTLDDVLRGALGAVDGEFGYNPRFRYPREGGIRRLADALAARAAPVERGREVVRIRARSRRAVLADGEEIAYDRLVATAPLPTLVRMVDDLPPAVRARAEALRWCAVTTFNFGLDRPLDHDRHWIYVPDPELPFHRVGFPSRLAPGMAEEGRGSVTAEVSRPAGARPPDDDDERRVLEALVRIGVIEDARHVVTRRRLDLPFAYVRFDRARREALPPLFAALLERGIVPIGRFGSWSYLSMEDAIRHGTETAAWLRGGST